MRGYGVSTCAVVPAHGFGHGRSGGPGFVGTAIKMEE